MTQTGRPRRERPLELLAVAWVLALLILSGLGGALALSRSGASPTRAGPTPAMFLPAGAPTQSCPGGNPAFFTQLVLASPAFNGTWNATQWTIGPSPITATFNVTVWGDPISYTVVFQWGDGATAYGTFNKTTPSNLTQTFAMSHDYTFAAMLHPWVWTNYTCASGPGVNATGTLSNTGSLTVYNSAGLYPISVSVNRTTAPVPANVTFNATVAGAPANATALWTISAPADGSVVTFSQALSSSNTTSFAPDLSFPSFYDGNVQILYPASGLVYSIASLPIVNVTPLVLVNVGNAGSRGSSPWNVTYWGNVTYPNGSSYPLGSDLENWTFFDFPAGGNSYPALTSYGPTIGSPVWREYVDPTSSNWYVSGQVNILRPDGVTIGYADTGILLLYNYSSYRGPTLNLWVTPNNGSAPLYFNATAQVTPSNASSAPYLLEMGVTPVGGGTLWLLNVSNWSGAAVYVPGVLTSAGHYYLFANVLEFQYGNWTWVAGANVTIVVGPGSTSGGGPVLAVSVTPTSGSAPFFFNATPQLTGYYGPAYLNLTLTVRGGSAGTALSFNALSWNGSAVTVMGVLPLAGNYTLQVIVVTGGPNVTLVGETNVSLSVLPAKTSAGPVLSFSASPANGSAPLNVSLDLSVTGGLAPYNLTVCTEGPFASPNGSGPCASVASDPTWNGSSRSLLVPLNWSGNYTVVASVTDFVGRNSTAVDYVVVGPSAPTAPLSARAAYIAPNAITSDGATYGFTTTISGGVGPYDIQWTFGDGSSGSAVAGSTITHTYRSSGTFSATLTVIDARGHRATASVGPLVVVLPLAPGAGTAWWASSGLLGLAAVLGIACAAILALTLQRLARRREALNWLRELEERRTTTGPESGPK